jgi:hypothetical protein
VFGSDFGLCHAEHPYFGSNFGPKLPILVQSFQIWSVIVPKRQVFECSGEVLLSRRAPLFELIEMVQYMQGFGSTVGFRNAITLFIFRESRIDLFPNDHSPKATNAHPAPGHAFF